MGQVTTGQGIRQAGQGIAKGIYYAAQQRNRQAEKDRQYELQVSNAWQDYQAQQATGEAASFRMGEYEQERLAAIRSEQGVPEGPLEPQAQQAFDATEARFAAIQEFAGRLPVAGGVRARFLSEERDLLKREAARTSRREIVDIAQDRLALGGFTFLDDTEMSPQVDERLQLFFARADDDDMDPGQLEEELQAISEIVVDQNAERMERKRVTARIDQVLDASLASRNLGAAQRAEQVKANYLAGLLSTEDVADKLFEEETGRKTQRAAGPSPYELRAQAMAMFAKLADAGVYRPTDFGEETLIELEGLIAPPGARAGEGEYMNPPTEDPEVLRAMFQNRGPQQQPAAAPGETPPAAPQVGGTVPPPASAQVGGTVPPQTIQGGAQGTQGPVAATAPKKAGKPPKVRKWAQIPVQEQEGVLESFFALLTSGNPPPEAKAAKQVGLDLDTVPWDVIEPWLEKLGWLQEESLEAQKKAKKQTNRRNRAKPGERMRTRG